jgi:predicted glycosyltransferase
MRVWYDACTGKHIRYGSIISKRFRKAGHEVIFTTRKHPDTLPLAQIVGETPIIVGKYRPETLFSRLEESATRVTMFAKMFKDNPPSVAVAHQSVELCRTAFGLKIPIILTADTPHAEAVNRLTIPFAHTLVVSEALPNRFLKKYCPKNVVRFKGVDEVAWVRDLKPPQTSAFEKPLIVVRELETKAIYTLETSDRTLRLIKKLETIGRVLFLKRYIDKKEFVDSARIVANADLVVSSGGTIAREAALQGVPSIITSKLGKTSVNTYLAKKGFPIFISKPEKALRLVKEHLGNKINVAAKLANLENPVDVIEKVAKELQQEEKVEKTKN